jgi:hypothetical protein
MVDLIKQTLCSIVFLGHSFLYLYQVSSFQCFNVLLGILYITVIQLIVDYVFVKYDILLHFSELIL